MREMVLPPQTVLATNEFQRFGQYRWNDVMALMAQNEDFIIIEDHHVRINRLKYKTFIRDYCDGKLCCSSCGVHPSHAVVFSGEQSSEKFINLFALENGKEILFTHDHTIARSLGGKNELDNTTTMCEDCNRQKSVFESIYGNHKLDIITNYLTNSLGNTVSLSQLDHLTKTFDISSIDRSKNHSLLYQMIYQILGSLYALMTTRVGVTATASTESGVDRTLLRLTP